MKTVLNLMSAAAVVVAGAFAAATTTAPEAVAVQPVAKVTHSQILKAPISEPQWAESPFMNPEPQMAGNHQVAPAGDVLRGAQWQTVSDDVESGHTPQAAPQRFVF